MNFVHKLCCIQNITGQPLSYFEKIVFKKDVIEIEAKQKSKQKHYKMKLLIGNLEGILISYAYN